MVSFYNWLIVLAFIPVSYENILLTKLIAEILECSTRESGARKMKGQASCRH